MIEYYYIYLINKKFSFKTKNICIFSVLEDALSTKCIVFSFPLKLNSEEKKLQDRETKIQILLY